MADVQAIFGTLLAVGISFPGMLLAGWLLFPDAVARGEARIRTTPGKTLMMGLATAIVVAIPVTFFLALPFAPAKFIGGGLLLAVFGSASLGAGGLASVMGRRLAREDRPPWKAFMAGAVALELAVAFPVLGWLFFLPLALLTSLGAASFALLRWEGRGVKMDAEALEGRLANEPQSA